MSEICLDDREHREQGRKDFERRGPYGYDYGKYNDRGDDCNRAYRAGFDEAMRDEKHRQEERDEERRQGERDDALYEKRREQQYQEPPDEPQQEDF